MVLLQALRLVLLVPVALLLAAQALLEILAVFVALRTWLRFFTGRRRSLTFRADSSAALAVLDNMSSSKPGINHVAAEIALLLEIHGVDDVKGIHVPGALNTLEDWLSRTKSPGGGGELPSALKGAKRLTPRDSRDESFYRLPTPGRRPQLWGSSAASALPRDGAAALRAEAAQAAQAALTAGCALASRGDGGLSQSGELLFGPAQLFN